MHRRRAKYLNISLQNFRRRVSIILKPGPLIDMGATNAENCRIPQTLSALHLLPGGPTVKISEADTDYFKNETKINFTRPEVAEECWCNICLHISKRLTQTVDLSSRGGGKRR